MTPPRSRVLFVCGTNSCRSQMAEGLANARYADHLDSASAGVRQGAVHPMTLAVMEEAAVDMTGHNAKHVSSLRGRRFDVVVTLCDEARELCMSPPGPRLRSDDAAPPLIDPLGPLIVGAPLHLHWPVLDPAEAGGDTADLRAAFRAARDQIAEQLAVLVERDYLRAIMTSRHRLEMLADELPTGLIAHDEHRRIYVFNHAAEQLLGRSSADVLGYECSAAFEGLGICASGCECVRSTAGHQSACEAVHRVNGKNVHLRIERAPDPVHGGMVAFLTDISEQVALRDWVTRSHECHGIIGHSDALRRVLEAASLAARSEYPVLITGESGTGKELLARAIHKLSPRADGPFVAVNCGAIPENLVESEFFGHIKGAFTGADRNQDGRFALARGGTLFLDEIAELPMAAQVKLLRVLQEGVYERVGDGRPLTADVRIISATAVDLGQVMLDHQFRDDLYFRLAVIPLVLPPLRERREDIPLLIRHFLDASCVDLGRTLSLSATVMERLTAYAWPGNVREVTNVVRYLTVMCTGTVVHEDDLPAYLRAPAPTATLETPDARAPISPTDLPPRRELTVEWVKAVLRQCGDNRVRAATELGVARATLYRFLGKHGMV